MYSPSGSPRYTRLPSIESDKPGPGERRRKSSEVAVPDLFLLEQRVGQMNEAFSAVCGKIESLVETHVRGKATPVVAAQGETDAIERLKREHEEERKGWEMEKGRMQEELRLRDAEIERIRKKYREAEEEMRRLVVGMKEKVGAATEKLARIAGEGHDQEEDEESVGSLVDVPENKR